MECCDREFETLLTEIIVEITNRSNMSESTALEPTPPLLSGIWDDESDNRHKSLLVVPGTAWDNRATMRMIAVHPDDPFALLAVDRDSCYTLKLPEDKVCCVWC